MKTHEFLYPDSLVGPAVDRVARAKRAYTTRRVPLAAMTHLMAGPQVMPQTGDLVLARVGQVGRDAALENTVSRQSALFVGDEIVVACAARHAPDHFDARLPLSLDPCHLAAGGGIAGQVVARHAGAGAPTEIEPIGLLCDLAGVRANLARHAVAPTPLVRQRQPVTLVSLGTSTNAGQTTSAAYLIRGMTRAGLRVAAAQVTGTGSGNGPGLLRDAGAAWVLDVVDAGWASTCGLSLQALESTVRLLVAHLAQPQVDALVLELSDGLCQRETSALLASPLFRAMVDGVIFSAGDTMGARAGVDWLHRVGLMPLAIAGPVTRSPLARADAASATGLAVLGLDDLSAPATARALWEQAAQRRTGGAAA